MKKVLLTLVALACTSLWAAAQTNNAAAQPNTSGQTAGAPAPGATTTGNPTMTVEGCLSGSAGMYTLKDKNTGTTFALSGNTSKLADHVGHEIRVTGTTSGSGSSASSAAKDTASGDTSALGGTETINVTSFKHLSTSCSSK